MNRLSYYFLGGNIIFNSEIGLFPLSLSRQNWRPFLLSYVILTLESHSGGEYMYVLESGGIRSPFSPRVYHLFSHISCCRELIST